MAVTADRPIELLAPTTVATASEGGSVILEMTGGAFAVIHAAVLVAFDDTDAIAEYDDARQVYEWFAAITDDEAPPA